MNIFLRELKANFRSLLIWAAIVEVGGRPLLAAMILAFGAFLWIAYESLDIWIDGLKHRLIKGKSEA